MDTIESMADVDLSLYDYMEAYEMLEEEKDLVRKRESVFTDDDTISISKFVNTYLDVDIDCSNLYHEGLKELLDVYQTPNIITPADLLVPLPNKIAEEQPELVYQGYILLVIDNKRGGVRKDYLSPFILREILRKPYVEERKSELMKKGINDLKCINAYTKQFYTVCQELSTIELYEQIVDGVKRHTKLIHLKEKSKGVKKYGQYKRK